MFSEVEYKEYVPEMIYGYVGVNQDGMIVTRQCASDHVAARECVRYAMENGVDKSTLSVYRLDKCEISVKDFNPIVREV